MPCTDPRMGISSGVLHTMRGQLKRGVQVCRPRAHNHYIRRLVCMCSLFMHRSTLPYRDGYSVFPLSCPAAQRSGRQGCFRCRQYSRRSRSRCPCRNKRLSASRDHSGIFFFFHWQIGLIGPFRPLWLRRVLRLSILVTCNDC